MLELSPEEVEKIKRELSEIIVKLKTTKDNDGNIK